MNLDKAIEKALQHKSQLEARPLIWKGQHIPGYYIRNDGVLYYTHPTSGLRHESSLWKINGRNYGVVKVEGHIYQYRIDYMVAYTFMDFYEDAIRLIHVNGDIADDHVDNLMWYRKVDVMDKYKDLAIVESDGSIKEEWRPCITEHNPNLGYEVSNFGMIRDKNHVLLPLKESHGYRVFYYLDADDGKETRIKAVHRAVAEAFIPNPNNYALVNHLDGNKMNDYVSNLEWADDGMNMEHAYLQHLNTHTKYKENQIRAVCQLLCSSDISHVQIAYMTGVDRKTISDIYRGRRWKNISSHYDMRTKKWNDSMKEEVQRLILEGMKGKEIFDKLNMPYDQSAISFYERQRRELLKAGKLAKAVQ